MIRDTITIETRDWTVFDEINKLAKQEFIPLFGKRWFVGSMSTKAGGGDGFLCEVELCMIVEKDHA